MFWPGECRGLCSLWDLHLPTLNAQSIPPPTRFHLVTASLLSTSVLVSPTLLPQPLPRALPAHGSPALQTQTDSFKKPGQRGSGAPGGAGARHPLRDRLLLPQAGTGLPSLLPDPRAGIRTAANLGEGCVMANDDLSVSPISKDGGWGKRDEAGKETRDADPNPRSSPSSRRLLHTTSPTHR